MANMLANFGLEFLEESDNVLMGFIGHIAEEGKAVQNYFGCPYFFLPMGNSEFWLKTQKKDEKNYTIDGFDTHCGNTCVWEVVHSGFDITPNKRGFRLTYPAVKNIMNKNDGGVP